MLKRLKIRNYESLVDADLEFSKFTVLVGKSSSGKSAILRALVALASNERGTKSITLGTSSYCISAEVDDATLVLEKGKETRYKIVQAGKEKPYDALNGKVPEDVTRLLGIEPLTSSSTSVNVAFQYDAPYLLRSSAGEVAKTFGELTGINKIFNAVSEANKRKRSFSATLKLRTADSEKVLARLAKFSDLEQKMTLLAEVEEQYEKLNTVRNKKVDLSTVLLVIKDKKDSLERVHKIKKPPSIGRLSQLHDKLVQYQADVRELSHKKKLLDKAKADVVSCEVQKNAAIDLLSKELRSLGYCPTCDRSM